MMGKIKKKRKRKIVIKLKNGKREWGGVIVKIKTTWI